MELLDLFLQWSAVLLAHLGRALSIACEVAPKLFAALSSELEWLVRCSARLLTIALSKAFWWFTRTCGNLIHVAYTESPKVFAEVSKLLLWFLQWSTRLCSKALYDAYTASPKIFAEISKQLGLFWRWYTRSFGETLHNAYRASSKISAEVAKQFGLFLRWSLRLGGKALYHACNVYLKIVIHLIEKSVWAIWWCGRGLSYMYNTFPTLLAEVQEKSRWVLGWLARSCIGVLRYVGYALLALTTILRTILDPPLKAYPYAAFFTAFLICIGPWFLLLPYTVFYFLLRLLGFGTGGVIGGSPAARFQSSSYGAWTPAGSAFALLQSLGMQYNQESEDNAVFALVRVLAGAVGVYVLFWIIWA